MPSHFKMKVARITSRHPREGTRHGINNQRMGRAEERRLSVQYLANQKPPSYLQSVFSI